MSRKRKPIEIGSVEFKNLQDKWYRKLQKSGFQDIELAIDRSGRLIPGTDQPDYHDQRETLVGKFTRQETTSLDTNILFSYYRLCRIFLSHAQFRSRIHEKVFKLYAEGLSYREIARILDKTRRKHLARSVWYVSELMQDNKHDLLNFHLSHPEGEYLHAVDTPSILDPAYSPHLKTKRGKSKY